MALFKKIGALLILTISVCSCMHSSGDDWTSAVPENTSFIIIPARNATIQSVLSSNYAPFIEDISSAATQIVAQIDSIATQSMTVESVLLYPGTDQKFAPVWITNAPDDFEDTLLNKYAHEFSQNKYQFHDVDILNLQFDGRHIFIARLDNYLLTSESSLAIENAIRAYRGLQAGANLAGVDLRPGSVVMNTPALNQWVSELARVQYQPKIKNAFSGTSPALLQVAQQGDSTKNQFHFSGKVPFQRSDASPLVNVMTHENKPITLDAYVSANAAAFGIFHATPPAFPSSMPDTLSVDQYLISHRDAYQTLSSSLGSEIGLVMYAESGFLSTGEYLYLRKLKNPESLRNELEKLSNEGVIKKVEGVYFAQSYSLSQLLGSRLCNFTDFYINITGRAVVVSKRKGLAQLVASDRSRRRTVPYEMYYQKMKEDFPEEPSGLFVTGPEFNSFITPFLSDQNYLSALTSSYKYLALTTQLDGDHALSLNLSTYNTENKKQAFTDNWIYDTHGADLAGPPVFGNIGGSYNDEIVFATKTGNVYALATDGTIVQQYNTGSDEPTGSPVVNDWYGTGQNVVLLAAGDKIYGWDENGELLPRFPFELDEAITTPLVVGDINNNKLPDAIVATADRRLHVLNGRGHDLSGWPVRTNAPIRTAPLLTYYQNVSSVVAFASNAVHAWDASGRTLRDFPLFIDAEFGGAPAKFENVILGNSVDGNLYAIGTDSPFTDSLNVYHSNSSSEIEAVNVSNGPLSGTPATDQHSILVTSNSGSVFLLNANGKLRLTKSMGQPSASRWSSQLTDIDGDGNKDIVALANYGRLYSWQIPSGKRIFDLPTAGMSNVTIGDIDGDGLMELVAQTDDGVQCWTINRVL